MNGRLSFVPQHGSRKLEKRLYTRKYTSECKYWENKGHTGVVLVSRCGCQSPLILPPHYLQTAAAYTPSLEHLAV